MQLPDNFYTDSLDRTYLKTERESLKFKYGNVKYDNFSENYDNPLLAFRFEDQKINGSLVSCLFSAAIAGLVKTTYHTALTIFSAMPQALYHRNSDYLLLQAQYIAKDFQEAAGYLIAGLYDSKWGLFLIQESITQKTCYNIHRSQKEAFAKIESNFVACQELSNNINSLLDDPLKNPLITTQKKAKNFTPTFPPLLPLPTNPNDAIYEITAQHMFGESGDHLYCLARQYYEEKMFDQAYIVLNYFWVNKEHRIEMAEDLYDNGDYELAYKIIDHYSVDPKIIGNFKVKLADNYYNLGDLGKSGDMIKGYGVVETKIQTDFYLKLANEHFKQKNYAEATDLIKISNLNNNVKGSFLENFAIIDLLDGKLSEACGLINQFSIGKDVRLKFVTPLLQKYEKEKDWKNLEIVAGSCDEEQKHHYFALLIKQNLLKKHLKATILRII